MDKNHILTEEEKDAMYKKLADLLISGLEREYFTILSESEQCADYIYERMEALKTSGELLSFLSDLSRRWDLFSSAYLDMKKDDLIADVEKELAQLSVAAQNQ